MSSLASRKHARRRSKLNQQNQGAAAQAGVQGDKDRQNGDKIGDLCSLKSSLACPSHLVHVLKKQTRLDEASIHARYMKFRQQYPTGFVGQAVFRELCQEASLGKEETDKLVDMIFSLYASGGGSGGRRKSLSPASRWKDRLIGFREVVLATENIAQLDEPEKVLRWIFRIHDADARGLVGVGKIAIMVEQILSLCMHAPDVTSLKEHTAMITSELDMAQVAAEVAAAAAAANNNGKGDKNDDDTEEQIVEKPEVTEEEFVFDALNNEMLFRILRASTNK